MARQEFVCMPPGGMITVGEWIHVSKTKDNISENQVMPRASYN